MFDKREAFGVEAPEGVGGVLKVVILVILRIACIVFASDHAYSPGPDTISHSSLLPPI